LAGEFNYGWTGMNTDLDLTPNGCKRTLIGKDDWREKAQKAQNLGQNTRPNPICEAWNAGIRLQSPGLYK